MNLRQYLFIILALCIFSGVMVTAHATNIVVSGITSPAAANGVYAPAGTLNSHTYWTFTSGGTTYYIYYHLYNGTDGYWNIDNDTDDSNVFFYSNINPDVTSPANALSWAAYGTGAGSPLVVVQGAAPFARINVLGNSTRIASGDTLFSFYDYTNFGSVLSSSGTFARTYSITNSGTGSLSITNVAISGANASDFSITASPASTVAASGSTTFTVTFTPSAVGKRNAKISITSNDSIALTYTFAIQGYGFISSNVIVSGITTPAAANGTYIYRGVLNNFRYWKHQTGNYYLYNDNFSNARYWNIDTDSLSTAVMFWSKDHGDDYSPINVTAWDTTQAGVYAVGASVIVSPVSLPKINLKGNNVSISSSTTATSFTNNTMFGSVNIASGNRTRKFVIQNTGTAALTLSGSTPYVTISGTDAFDFSVTTPPSASIAAGDTSFFIVTFDPSTVGTKKATLTISNNDGDASTYTFAIQGEGTVPTNLVVSGITTPSAANGMYLYKGIVNDFLYYKHQTAAYYIYNSSYQGTRYWNIDNDSTDAKSLFFSKDHSDSAAVANVTAWDTSGGLGGRGTPVLTTSSITGVGDVEKFAPKVFALGQNYPNPFNPSTVIEYQLAASGEVSLKVFDVIGREVATLVHATQVAGSHSVEWNASRFASGVYFYKLQAGSNTSVKKLRS